MTFGSNARPLLLGLLLLTPTRASRAESAATPYVWIDGVSVTEGDTGTTKFTTTVTSSWYQPVTVDIQAFTGTASANDFNFNSVRLTLQPGIRQTISGEIIGDREPEGDEFFELRATSGDGGYVNSRSGSITIIDDDFAGAPRLSIESVKVPEGDAGLTRVAVKVRLEPAAAFPVEVEYATIDGSARTADRDYVATQGTLTFAPGEVQKTIPIDVIGDQLWERDATFQVTLKRPPRVVLEAGTALVTIVNDDKPPVVTIDDVKVTEGNAGTKTVNFVARVERPTRSMKIHVVPMSGSARLGEDWNGGFEVLYPTLEAPSVSFSLEVIGDSVPECDEGVVIQYRAMYGGEDTMKEAHLVIQDDDGGPRDPAQCEPLFTPAPTTRDAGPPDTATPNTGAPRDAGTPEEKPALDGGATPKSPDRDAAIVTTSLSSSGCSFGAGALGGPALVAAVFALLSLLTRGRRERARGRS